MLGLATPLALLALAAAGVLIALAVFQRHTRVTPVSSLLLWRQIPARPTERQGFRMDVLLALQLLALLALAVGWARPYLERPGAAPGGGLVAVLDVSASMQTRAAVDTGFAGTRFVRARRRLEALLDELPARTPVMLIAAGDRPRVVERWTEDGARVRERLATVEPLDTPTNLGPAVEIAAGEAARRPGVRAVVLTDLAPEASGVAPALIDGVDWLQVGDAAENVGITGLAVDAPPFGDARDASARVEVRSFASSIRRVRLEARVEELSWVRRDLVLAPHAVEHVVLDRPPGPGVLQVKITPDDALAVDDTAVSWIPHEASLDLLLVTDSDGLAGAMQRLVAGVPHGHLEVVNEAGLRERAPLAAIAGLVTVFDRIVPATADVPSALYVGPTPGNPVCPAARRLDGASVVDWEPAHPVLAGLEQLAALEVDHASQLTAPAWGATVVTAAARHVTFPLLVVGEVGGRRRACLAAELPVPLLTSDAVPLVMLTLSTLHWLAETPGDAPLVIPTGVPTGTRGALPAPAAAGLRVAGDPPVVLAERTGVYRSPLADGSERLVLANLLDARESDVARDDVRDRAAVHAAAAMPPAPARRELAWWCWLLAGALLALEWAAWVHR